MKIRYSVLLFVLLLAIFTINSHALEEKDLFIHDMDSIFIKYTGYNKTDLNKEFEKTAYKNYDNEWMIIYTYIGPYTISYPKLTVNYRFTVKIDNIKVYNYVESNGSTKHVIT